MTIFRALCMITPIGAAFGCLSMLYVETMASVITFFEKPNSANFAIAPDSKLIGEIRTHLLFQPSVIFYTAQIISFAQFNRLMQHPFSRFSQRLGSLVDSLNAQFKFRNSTFPPIMH